MHKVRVFPCSPETGFTFGKSAINNGYGVFSKLDPMSETYGTYVAIAGHAGFMESIEGQIMTKDEALQGLSGKGWEMHLRFSLAVFYIKPRDFINVLIS
jgi:hypothetical protein